VLPLKVLQRTPIRAPTGKTKESGRPVDRHPESDSAAGNKASRIAAGVIASDDYKVLHSAADLAGIIKVAEKAEPLGARLQPVGLSRRSGLRRESYPIVRRGSSVVRFVRPRIYWEKIFDGSGLPAMYEIKHFFVGIFATDRAQGTI
jgi:hypothetical protein